jgi:putative spermidine/putrescine transport system substrate-binding protein
MIKRRATEPVSKVYTMTVLIVILIGCMALLSACGGSSDSSGDGNTGSDTTGAPEASGSITWYETAGGEVDEARQSILFPAFKEATGISAIGEYNPDATKLIASMESGETVPWDVVEFPSVGDFLRAREAGYLAPMDPKVVPKDQIEPDAYDKYGFHGERYGIVIAWNTEVWPESGKHPTSLKDIYNTKDFPGKRCMYEYPAFGATMESALLADGVPADELYPLDTKRAFAKLDTIKDDIVWYERDLVKLMLSGECDIAIGWTGQIYNAVREDEAPLAISWDDSLYAEAVFSVPKMAKNEPAGQAMLGFMVKEKDVLSEFSNAAAYPMGVKGLTYSAELQPWLAIGPNITTAVPEDAQYYQKNLPKLSSEFTEWLGS